MIKQIIKGTVLVLILFCIPAFAQEIKKENLSVLYVGYDPAVPADEKIISSPTGNGGMTPERFKEELKTRFGAFETYLKKYFAKVKSVDARSYTADLSAQYDVTIFDQNINPWEKMQTTPKYKPAKYLKEDFDFPTIFIGHTAPVMGGSIGLKIDWLCLCLDAEAHHLKNEHPIFKGPFPVSLTMVTKPTPEGIFHYPSGKNVPKEIPMWRVQTEGYAEGKGYRVGMVSRGEGFLDSPDAEYISSGVNSKDVGAVAIGRHGNFLLWGFSASPDYMTDEAKQVFANAVVYINKFKGQKPIVRKYNDKIATKSAADAIIGGLNTESFEKYKEYMVSLNLQQEKTVSELSAKKAKGEKLSEMEQAILSVQSKPIAIPTWEAYVKQTAQNFYKPEYVKNVDKLKKYLTENRKYLYSEPDDFYSLKIDEDAKKLGIENEDKQILKHCIDLLNKGKDTETASRLLLRYTGMEKSAQEWQQWYNENSSKLFFTEAGGFKWLVDTTDKSLGLK
ncbi:hypothetical protein [Flavobacterium ajazii]|uniref:hypothetical protein n=1 Tax=Flavobacterium ajazii TaxID=2692318 RepID=UPI0013D53D15|nr:hypothetical protein [Flavobacterium ajazii]